MEKINVMNRADVIVRNILRSMRKVLLTEFNKLTFYIQRKSYKGINYY